MTENEAREILIRDNDDMRCGYFCINDFLAIEVAIQALEEIQQYRAIGTIDEFKTLKEKNEPKKTNSFSGCICNNIEMDWDFMK